MTILNYLVNMLKYNIAQMKRDVIRNVRIREDMGAESGVGGRDKEVKECKVY